MRLSLGNRIDSGSGGWNVNKNLSLHYSSRIGLDLLETKSGLNLNAKIIPSCGFIDADNYIVKSTANFKSVDASGDIEIEFDFDGTNNAHQLFGTCDEASSQRYAVLYVINKRVIFDIRQNVTTIFRNTITTSSDLAAGKNKIKIISNGSAYSMDVNGSILTVGSGLSVTNGLNDGRWLNVVTLRDNITFGCVKDSGGILKSLATFRIYSASYSNLHKWYFTSGGNNAYDVIGGLHVTWTGTDHEQYHIDASTHLLNVGYTKYTKVGSPDEYVPYTTTNTPYDAAAFLTGYTKVADFVGGATIYNGAPSLVDFDYADGANALVGIFKKDDTTIYISTASMLYYDAANKYRWRNDELLNPAIYSDDYKKVGYKGRVMNKTTVSTIAKSISEILAYSEDQIGNKEWSLAKYCTLEDLVVQSGGSPIFDGDNYLTWV